MPGIPGCSQDRKSVLSKYNNSRDDFAQREKNDPYGFLVGGMGKMKGLSACCLGVAFAAALAIAPAVAADTKPMPEGAHVYILWPGDGQVIQGGKFWVRMGLSGAGIAPAGIDKQYTGHHHLIVDADLPPLDQEIPNDRNHLHFGRGQTEVRLELPPGKHTLQLLFGDANHVPQNPPLYSKKITITVLP